MKIPYCPYCALSVFQGLVNKQLVNTFGAPRSTPPIPDVHQNLMKRPNIIARCAVLPMHSGCACMYGHYNPHVCLKCVTESHRTNNEKRNSCSPFFSSLAGCPEDLGIYPQTDQGAFVVCKATNCHGHDPSSQICKRITQGARFLFLHAAVAGLCVFPALFPVSKWPFNVTTVGPVMWLQPSPLKTEKDEV